MRVDRVRAALVLAACASALGLVVADTLRASPAQLRAVRATGAMEITQSLAGQAILVTTNMRPGGPGTTGTVTIRNTGSVGGEMGLARELTHRDGVLVSDEVWPLLAQRLELNISGIEAGRTLYRGTLAGMTPQALGTLAPGESKTYELGVRLLASAEPAVAGSAVSVRFRWSATEAVPVPTPVPVVPVVPVVPPAPAPPAPAPPAPAPAPPPAGDATPPTLVLSGATRQRPARQKNGVRVAVRCGETCLVRASGRLRGKAKGVTRPASASLGAGASKTLSLRLPRAAIAAVRRGSKVSVIVTVTATDAAGNPTTARRTVKLER